MEVVCALFVQQTQVGKDVDELEGSVHMEPVPKTLNPWQKSL
jgi:hypothetical protein